MNSYSAVFLLAILGVSNAVTYDSACPDVSVVAGFNVTAYLGQWYQYGRYYTDFEVGSVCNAALYTANDDGTVGVFNSQVSSLTGIVSSISGNASVDDATTGLAKLTVTFPFSTAPYWVLGTDYTSYSIAWTCTETTDLLGVTTSDRFVFVITRDTIPSDDVIALATTVLDYNSIDTTILIVNDQTTC